METKDEANQEIFYFPNLTVSSNKVVILRLRTRLDANGGWNNNLQIKLNGEILGYKTSYGTRRLLNRKNSIIRTTCPGETEMAIFRQSLFGGEALFVAFASSWDTLDNRIMTDRNEMYWYAFDISDLLAKHGRNKLTLINLTMKKSYKKATVIPDLLIDRLEVGYLPKSVYSRYISSPAEGIENFQSIATINNNNILLDVSSNGGIKLNYNKNNYFLNASFSEPAAQIAYNEFSYKQSNKGHISTDKKSAESILIKGKFKYYEIDRLVTLKNKKVYVADTFKNTSTQDVGVIFRNNIVSDAISEDWYLSGLKGLSTMSDCRTHPTLFMRRKTGSIGAAICDTRTRFGMRSEGSSRSLSFYNQQFGLKKGTSYTVRWEIYLGDGDYFDFLNTLRQAWGVNHTIPGMWEFWDPSVIHSAQMKSKAVLKKYLDRKRIDIFAITPWFEYYYKPRFWHPREIYKKNLHKDINFIKNVQPDAQFLACTESFLYYVPLTFFKGTVPALPPNTRTDFDYKTTDTTTKIINNSVWSDSVYRDRSGRVILDRFYASRYSDTGVNLKVYPTLNNYWHKHFMGMLDYLLNDCNLNGIYIDCFCQFGTTYQIWDKWDNYSVKISSETGEITEKYTDMGLISTPARYQWAKYCIDRGKMIFVNSHPDAEELQSLPIISFAEAEYTLDLSAPSPRSSRAVKGQLSTPLAIGVRPHVFADTGLSYVEIIQRAVIAYLRDGILYCHYYTKIPPSDNSGGGEYGILNYMFPFTPVELHSGWVIGEERIISSVSRKFKWAKQKKPIVKRFNTKGIEIDANVQIKKLDDGWSVDVKLDDYNEIIVIM